MYSVYETPRGRGRGVAKRTAEEQRSSRLTLRSIITDGPHIHGQRRWLERFLAIRGRDNGGGVVRGVLRAEGRVARTRSFTEGGVVRCVG